MLPTLNATGDLLLHKSLALNNNNLKSKIKRGEVINFISPLNPSILACKRVIGIPGDKILIDPINSLNQFIYVPNGHIWVQGDNYAVSIDSRTYGPLPLGLVRGKIIARVWPKFSWLSKPFEFTHSDDSLPVE
ncbi:hypothetical protein O181_066801 [Austropuccinia psidii MF-1]|uniref:Peptidase S26 domain-containing protein n=1 Tax=Austropuccinia psidii MF-1 TaxID=1389203 RepID=A0A9Q3ERM1_9BASI|nr:hypothetical protein [Austropuccinia psidii MF-1]